MKSLIKVSIYLFIICTLSVLLSSCGFNNEKKGGVEGGIINPAPRENTSAPDPEQEKQEEVFNLEVEFASILNRANPFVSSVQAS